MSLRLKTLASLIVDQSDRGEFPYIALENLAGGTGALEPGTQLSIRQGGESGVSAVSPGDVLFGKLRPYLAKTLLIREPAYASTELLALRPRSGIEPRFLAYLVSSRPVIEWATASSDGTKMPRTSWEKLGELRIEVDLPTNLSSQCAIADYLDTETARIDTLIAKKQRMVELVEARRLSSIWTLLEGSSASPVKLKSLVSKVGSGSTPRGGADVYVDAGIAFLRSQNIRDGRVNLDDVVFISEDVDTEMSATRVQQGDVLLNITGGSIGRTAVVLDDDLPANVSQHVCIVRPKPEVSPVVLQAALETVAVREQIGLMQVGGNREGLNFEQVRNLLVLLPTSWSEGLTEKVAQANAHHRGIARSLVAQIVLLRERRQALITAAVTGEIKVPEVAA